MLRDDRSHMVGSHDMKSLVINGGVSVGCFMGFLFVSEKDAVLIMVFFIHCSSCSDT